MGRLGDDIIYITIPNKSSHQTLRVVRSLDTNDAVWRLTVDHLETPGKISGA